MRRHILDNRDLKVVDYLRDHLGDADQLSIVSAYFSIYGYDLLADRLGRVSETRFLFGDPSSIEDLTTGEKEAKAFELTENGLLPTQTLQQRPLARRCAEWVGSDAVAVRSVKRSNFLHGKMYLTADAGIVGSSNFTKNGLGGSDRPNLEINLAVADAGLLAELQEWFDELWTDDALTHDVKQQVLDALGRLGKDHDPQFIYYKTLYELFKDRMDAQLDSDRQLQEHRLTETAVWNKLYEFQKDGVRSVINRLKHHNGCILADSVGLGKTYTALAVIKYYEILNENVLVLCPNKLRQNWALYPVHQAQIGNPFMDDRFRYTLLAHTDLSRDSGQSGGVSLSGFNWGAFDLVVIDESHNFRNDGGMRYERLLDEIIKGGSSTKVLLLSATPVNTSLIDLRNQIHLMTERKEVHFRESLGVGHVGNLMATAQREFKEWEKTRSRHGGADKASLLARLGPEFLRLLDGVSIARSRRHITRFYEAEMSRIGQFPRRAAPANVYPVTDLGGNLSYEDLSAQIGRFTLSIYRPSDYLTDKARQLELVQEKKERNFNQRDREHYLVAMMRKNFLKRLESSPHALFLTLERTIAKMDALLDRIDDYDSRGHDREDLGENLPDEDEEDEDFLINRARHPYHLRELDLRGWRADIEQDREALTGVHERVRVITPARDGKLQELRKALRARVTRPTTDLDGKPNRKLLVFTTFKDTALYLYDALQPDVATLGVRMAMVSGDITRDTGRGDSKDGAPAHYFQPILRDFAPIAHARETDHGNGEIDLLIATDCISEGQNLQDCDTVLNYDIHWNPVRLIQRFGRIDRIGSRSQAVRMVNYWPTKDMDLYLDLENRVVARMALVDLTASGGDDPFTEDELREVAQLELNFRDRQLLRLQDEVLDLEDLTDNIALSDLSLDYFLAQLRQFLLANKEALEETPWGAYAIAPATQDGPGPGAIFLLRQRNAVRVGPRQRVASPVHPFYLVYIKDDGSIRYGSANARQALQAFESAAAGKAQPIRELCDQFDRETCHGQDMSHFDSLLGEVIAHVRQSAAKAAAAGLSKDGSRDFVLPKTSEAPKSPTDFDLVTWLALA
ncbi:MAG: helicase-related protein [Chloroflexota bacterium]|nr:helicase-related protein [Chloroflexota bacterium]